MEQIGHTSVGDIDKVVYARYKNLDIKDTIYIPIVED